MDKVKMFLFARWIATCYADTHLDENMKCEQDKGFDPNTAISVLNSETGYWYIEQLKYFNDTVYPNYIKTGTVKGTKLFLNNNISTIKKTNSL